MAMKSLHRVIREQLAKGGPGSSGTKGPGTRGGKGDEDMPQSELDRAEERSKENKAAFEAEYSSAQNILDSDAVQEIADSDPTIEEYRAAIDGEIERSGASEDAAGMARYYADLRFNSGEMNDDFAYDNTKAKFDDVKAGKAKWDGWAKDYERGAREEKEQTQEVASYGPVLDDKVDLNGCSNQGTLWASYKNIVDVLGEPNKVGQTGGKTEFEWRGTVKDEIGNKVPFAIFDFNGEDSKKAESWTIQTLDGYGSIVESRLGI